MPSLLTRGRSARSVRRSASRRGGSPVRWLLWMSIVAAAVTWLSYGLAGLVPGTGFLLFAMVLVSLWSVVLAGRYLVGRADPYMRWTAWRRVRALLGGAGALVLAVGLLTGAIIAAKAVTGNDGQRCVNRVTMLVVSRSYCERSESAPGRERSRHRSEHRAGAGPAPADVDGDVAVGWYYGGTGTSVGDSAEGGSFSAPGTGGSDDGNNGGSSVGNTGGGSGGSGGSAGGDDGGDDGGSSGSSVGGDSGGDDGD
jgi:hypothetical protein